jgi:peptidoglycan/LPS O-acetylase OafA/YrhL
MKIAITPVAKSMPRYPVLDGWRGISILCVLAAHMLPLGPKSWQLNELFALLGMCLFFTLSGFLITNTLIYRSNVRDFLMRRFCRILPLAWAFMLVALPLAAAAPSAYAAHFLFYANLPPFWLTPLTAHLWSLCVEMYFYLAIALIFTVLGQRGLLILLPLLCLAVTAGRIWQGVPISIITYYRVDEILSGACLALILVGRLGEYLPRFLSWVNPYLLLGLLLLTCHPAIIPANYLRPYLAAALVGSTLYQSESRMLGWLKKRALIYLATVSYALYVIHPLTTHGWFESGGTIIKYGVKRPLSFLITFALAHLSTFYYEKRWIALGKRWTTKAATA